MCFVIWLFTSGSQRKKGSGIAHVIHVLCKDKVKHLFGEIKAFPTYSSEGKLSCGPS